MAGEVFCIGNAWWQVMHEFELFSLGLPRFHELTPSLIAFLLDVAHRAEGEDDEHQEPNRDDPASQAPALLWHTVI